VWQLQDGGYLRSCNKLCSVIWQKNMTEDLNLQQHCCRNFRSCKRVSLHEQYLSRLRHSTVPVILSAPSQTTNSPILININPLPYVLWCLYDPHKQTASNGFCLSCFLTKTLHALLTSLTNVTCHANLKLVIMYNKLEERIQPKIQAQHSGI